MKQPLQKLRKMLHLRRPSANSNVVIVKAPTSSSASISASVSTATFETPPQISFLDVETNLNMHSPNGYFDSHVSDGANGTNYSTNGVPRRDEPIRAFYPVHNLVFFYRSNRRTLTKNESDSWPDISTY